MDHPKPVGEVGRVANLTQGMGDGEEMGRAGRVGSPVTPRLDSPLGCRLTAPNQDNDNDQWTGRPLKQGLMEDINPATSTETNFGVEAIQRMAKTKTKSVRTIKEWF